MSVLDLVRDDLRDFAGYASARRANVTGHVWLNANESPWASPADADGLSLHWKTAGDKPFPMPVQVRVGDKVLDVAMTGGRGHLDLPAGATYTLDPHSRVLRELPHIAEFQKDTAERAKAAAKKR